ncbi:hypothetical protein MMPV_003227 [Pyropia vietnamensis]
MAGPAAVVDRVDAVPDAAAPDASTPAAPAAPASEALTPAKRSRSDGAVTTDGLASDGTAISGDAPAGALLAAAAATTAAPVADGAAVGTAAAGTPATSAGEPGSTDGGVSPGTSTATAEPGSFVAHLPMRRNKRARIRTRNSPGVAGGDAPPGGSSGPPDGSGSGGDGGGTAAGATAETRQATYVSTAERKNAAFEDYYRAQGIVRPDEWDVFLKTLSVSLPTAFRLTTSGRLRTEIEDRLEGEFVPLCRAYRTDDGTTVEPPHRLEWYPQRLAWQLSIPRTILRRSAALGALHRFLIGMNDLGAINRQEAVSMIPPLLLQVRPGMHAIDLCAAPGSKTAQLLDMLVGGRGVPSSTPAAGASALATPSEAPANCADAAASASAPPAAAVRAPVGPPSYGLVVANDSDLKRCWMLAHQLKRFTSPDVVVTSHEAQRFPGVATFDRVLADVPCSGDGTLRKAPDLWRKWNPNNGHGLHRLQLAIAIRGKQLLRPGGVMVYSTCSLNPVENEAVVAALLRATPSIRLLDVSDELPGLRRRPGLTTWRVKNHSGGEDKGWFSSIDEVPERRRRRMVPTLFPPSPAEAKALGLERCLRVVPHDADTGGFFVAVLKKDDAAPALTSARATTPTPSSVTPPAPPADASATAPAAEAADAAAAAAAVTTVAADMDAALAPVAAASAAASPADGSGAAAPTTDAAAPAADAAAPVGSATTPPAGVDAAVTDGNPIPPPPSTGTEAATEDTAAEQKKYVPARGGKRGRDGKQASRLVTDDPFTRLHDIDPASVVSVANFYGIDETACREGLLTRSSDAATMKRVYYVSAPARALLAHAITGEPPVPGAAAAAAAATGSGGDGGGGGGGGGGRLRVVNCGVRVFERNSRAGSGCLFRLTYDGVHLLLPSMGKRVVAAPRADFLKLLESESTSIGDLVDVSLRTTIGDLSKGSFVVRMADSAEDDVIVAWKGGDTLTTFIPKEMLAVLRKRYGVVEVVAPEKDIKADKGKQAANGGAKEEDVDDGAEEGNGDGAAGAPAPQVPSLAKPAAADDGPTEMDVSPAAATMEPAKASPTEPAGKAE